MNVQGYRRVCGIAGVRASTETQKDDERVNSRIGRSTTERLRVMASWTSATGMSRPRSVFDGGGNVPSRDDDKLLIGRKSQIVNAGAVEFGRGSLMKMEDRFLVAIAQREKLGMGKQKREGSLVRFWIWLAPRLWALKHRAQSKRRCTGRAALPSRLAAVSPSTTFGQIDHTSERGCAIEFQPAAAASSRVEAPPDRAEQTSPDNTTTFSAAVTKMVDFLGSQAYSSTADVDILTRNPSVNRLFSLRPSALAGARPSSRGPSTTSSGRVSKPSWHPSRRRQTLARSIRRSSRTTSALSTSRWTSCTWCLLPTSNPTSFRTSTRCTCLPRSSPAPARASTNARSSEMPLS